MGAKASFRPFLNLRELMEHSKPAAQTPLAAETHTPVQIYRQPPVVGLTGARWEDFHILANPAPHVTKSQKSLQKHQQHESSVAAAALATVTLFLNYLKHIFDITIL